MTKIIKQLNRPDNIDILAVDADIVSYRCAAVCEDNDVKTVCETVDEFIYNLVRGTGINKLLFCLSDSINFRYARATTKPYKGNRTKCKYNTKRGCTHPAVDSDDCLFEGSYTNCQDYVSPIIRPRHLETVKSYLTELYQAKIQENYEADDYIASYITQFPNAAHAGIDKDIRQVTGWHYDFVKHHWEFTSAEDTLLKVYRQVCQGDTSDNIPGLPGIGEKKAAKAILEPSTAKEDAYRLYQNIMVEMTDEELDAYFKEQYDLIHLVTSIKLQYDSYVIVDPPAEFSDKSEAGDYDSEEEIEPLDL